MARIIAKSTPKAMFICMATFVAVVSFLAEVNVKVHAQQRTEGGYTDSGKLPWIVTKGRLDKMNEPEKVVADFATEKEAKAARDALDNSLTGGAEFKWIYSVSKRKAADSVDKGKQLLDKVKEAKDAVDKARAIASGEKSFLEALEAKERKLGDTAKEYADALKKSFEQARDAKKTLTSGVKGKTEATFKKVNELIDKYNNDLSAFQSVMGPNFKTGFSPIPRMGPDSVGSSSTLVNLEGTTWQRTVTDASQADGFTWKFQGGGKIESVHKDGTVYNYYSYRVDGSKIWIKLTGIKVNGRDIPVGQTTERECVIDGKRIRSLYYDLTMQ